MTGRTAVLRCARLVTAQGIEENRDVVVDGSRIVAVRRPRGEATEEIRGWAVPGFVDTHCHGGGGADYASGDPGEIRRARAFHLRHGTTTTYASLVTADLDELVGQIRALRPLVETGELAGIHLEGPFLSPAKCGAHDAALLRAPDPTLVERLLLAGGGAVRMITVAPELAAAEVAIRHLWTVGVAAAIGHTDADFEIAARSLGDGVRVATHLFNAIRPLHHREPGPIPLLLTDDRVLVEIIADGFHVHPHVVALAVAAAGPERVALVTDAMAAAGMPDGNYRIGHLDVAVRDAQARLVRQDGSPGPIAGSTLTMAGAVANLVRFGFGVPEAAVMAATTPARHHGLDDVGLIAPGRRANMCVLDAAGRLRRVLYHGEWVV